MRLTYASLGAFIKYPWLADDALNKQRPIEKKYGVYQSELALFEEVADATGLLKLGEGLAMPPPIGSFDGNL